MGCQETLSRWEWGPVWIKTKLPWLQSLPLRPVCQKDGLEHLRGLPGISWTLQKTLSVSKEKPGFIGKQQVSWVVGLSRFWRVMTVLCFWEATKVAPVQVMWLEVSLQQIRAFSCSSLLLGLPADSKTGRLCGQLTAKRAECVGSCLLLLQL